MLASLTQLAPGDFTAPTLDFHALAPEIILLVTVVVLVLLDSIKLDRAKALMPAVTNLGLLAALIPLLTLAYDGTERFLFGGSYVVGSMALVLKALFIVSAYVVILLSTNYVAEGDYWESEYYTLIVSSVLGMVVMASSRDLIGIFVALELLSIPAYMLAAWRKGDVKSNEAGMKYYLMGVFASAILLYGMSLVYGVGGSTRLTEIALRIRTWATPASRWSPWPCCSPSSGSPSRSPPCPFHVWAPDTYEGAPTPVTAFLAVASKAAGFVALIQVVFSASSSGRTSSSRVLRAVDRLDDGGQPDRPAPDQHRPHARLLGHRPGRVHAGPVLVIAADPGRSLQAIITYLVIYAAMNLGAFACIIAIARKTRSAEIDDFGGLFPTCPASPSP